MLFFSLCYDILSLTSLKITQVFHLLLGFVENQLVEKKIQKKINQLFLCCIYHWYHMRLRLYILNAMDCKNVHSSHIQFFNFGDLLEWEIDVILTHIVELLFLYHSWKFQICMSFSVVAMDLQMCELQGRSKVFTTGQANVTTAEHHNARAASYLFSAHIFVCMGGWLFSNLSYPYSIYCIMM